MRRQRLIRIVRTPIDDYLRALTHVLPPVTGARVVGLLAGAVAAWWVYVPLHELAHALGCVLGGGEITRLEIEPIYGATILQRVFPFVAVGSDYAGQLTGFDTRGSDATFLLTDFLPFTLTIFIGVPLLAQLGRAAGGGGRCVLLGACLPLAFAPFVSLTGDYYEMGSILVSRAVASVSPGFAIDRWRSDDLFLLVGELSATARPQDVAGVTTSLLVGCLLAWGTYGAGRALAGALLGRSRPVSGADTSV